MFKRGTRTGKRQGGSEGTFWQMLSSVLPASSSLAVLVAVYSNFFLFPQYKKGKLNFLFSFPFKSARLRRGSGRRGTRGRRGARRAGGAAARPGRSCRAKPARPCPRAAAGTSGTTAPPATSAQSTPAAPWNVDTTRTRHDTTRNQGAERERGGCVRPKRTRGEMRRRTW